MIFISHATPQDNEFARWLSLKLAGAGFSVWSDVTKLIGGEKFWTEIEGAISQHSSKFLLCVTKDCNKPGVLREIEVAQRAEKLKKVDLIVPLKLDETAFRDFPLDLGKDVNAVRFDHGWAQGLAALLDVFKRQNIQPKNSDGASIVSQWWKSTYPVDEGVTQDSELCVSNLFPHVGGCETIWYHPAGGFVKRGLEVEKLPVLVESYGNGFLSFENPEVVAEALPRFRIVTNKSRSAAWKECLKTGFEQLEMPPRQFRNLFQSLLRRAFEQLANSRKCRTYPLSAKKRCFWIEKDKLVNDEQTFAGVDGKRHGRSLVGYKSLNVTKEGLHPKRYWHFAVQCAPTFELTEGIFLKSHVVFTSDGKTLYESDTQQHRARRNQGKSWWNDAWRDRNLAFASYLAGGAESISLPVARDGFLSFAVSPVEFATSSSYRVIETQPIDSIPDEDDLDDEGEEEDGE